MTTFDFTPVQGLLGREVCFRDFAFEASFREYEHAFKDIAFKEQVYRDRFRFGLVSGCTADLDESGAMRFGILIDEDYFSLSEMELLFVSNEQS